MVKGKWTKTACVRGKHEGTKGTKVRLVWSSAIILRVLRVLVVFLPGSRSRFLLASFAVLRNLRSASDSGEPLMLAWRTMARAVAIIVAVYACTSLLIGNGSQSAEDTKPSADETSMPF